MNAKRWMLAVMTVVFAGMRQPGQRILPALGGRTGADGWRHGHRGGPGDGGGVPGPLEHRVPVRAAEAGNLGPSPLGGRHEEVGGGRDGVESRARAADRQRADLSVGPGRRAALPGRRSTSGSFMARRTATPCWRRAGGFTACRGASWWQPGAAPTGSGSGTMDSRSWPPPRAGPCSGSRTTSPAACARPRGSAEQRRKPGQGREDAAGIREVAVGGDAVGNGNGRHAGGGGGADAVDGILDDQAAGGRQVEPTRGLEEEVGGGLDPGASPRQTVVAKEAVRPSWAIQPSTQSWDELETTAAGMPRSAQGLEGLRARRAWPGALELGADADVAGLVEVGASRSPCR